MFIGELEQAQTNLRNGSSIIQFHRRYRRHAARANTEKRRRNTQGGSGEIVKPAGQSNGRFRPLSRFGSAPFFFATVVLVGMCSITSFFFPSIADRYDLLWCVSENWNPTNFEHAMCLLIRPGLERMRAEKSRYFHTFFQPPQRRKLASSRPVFYA